MIYITLAPSSIGEPLFVSRLYAALEPEIPGANWSPLSLRVLAVTPRPILLHQLRLASLSISSTTVLDLAQRALCHVRDKTYTTA